MDPLLYWYYLFGSLLFFAELLAGEFMFSLRYRRRSRFAVRAAVSASVGVAAVAAVNVGYCASAMLENEIVRGVITIAVYLVMFGVSLAVMRCCFDESFASVTMCGVASYASQHLIYNVLMIINRFVDFYAFAFASPLNNLLFNAGQAAFFALCYVAIYFVFAKKANGNSPDGIMGGKVLLLSLITLIVTLIFNGVRDLFMSESAGLYVICCLFAAMSCVFIIVIRAGIFEQNTLKKEMAVVNRLLLDDRRQFEMSRENIELINIKCHDIRRQLETFALQGRTPSDGELRELRDAVSIYDAMLKTGNDTLDIVLTERSLFCEKHGIRLTSSVDGGKLGFMSVSDICSFFGNALTNAIDAVLKLDDPDKRVISIVVREAVGQLSVLTENYYAGEVTFDGGLPQTTKQDRQYHGYGVKSMRAIAAKYDGTLSFEAADGVFRVAAMFPLPQS